MHDVLSTVHPTTYHHVYNFCLDPSKDLSSVPLRCGCCGVSMQPHGLSPSDNVVKECQEEASIPPALAATAKPVGAVSYMTGWLDLKELML